MGMVLPWVLLALTSALLVLSVIEQERIKTNLLTEMSLAVGNRSLQTRIADGLSIMDKCSAVPDSTPATLVFPFYSLAYKWLMEARDALSSATDAGNLQLAKSLNEELAKRQINPQWWDSRPDAQQKTSPR